MGPQRSSRGIGRRALLRATTLACFAAALPAPARGAATRLDVPFVTQLDGTPYAGTNCGPASLAMVWRYLLGAPASPDQLRRALMRLPGAGYASDPDQGTAIQDLAALGRQHGLRPVLGGGPASTGWTPAAVAEHVREGRPVVVLTRLHLLPGWAGAPADFDHWVVLVGVEGDRFWLHDPALPAPYGADRPIGRDGLWRAMAGSSVPGQGAAFGGGDGRPPRTVAAGRPTPAPREARSASRFLVRLGNGSRLTVTAERREPPRTVEHVAEPLLPPLDRFGTARFAPY